MAGRSQGEGPGPLDTLFAPRHVCVVGVADEPGDPGQRVLGNLLGSSVRVHVVPVRPGAVGEGVASYQGMPVVADPGEIPTVPDLAIVCAPAAEVPGWVRACGNAGVRSVLVTSEGFREAGVEGKRLEEELRVVVRESGVRLLGPGSLGLLVPALHLNASLMTAPVRSGSVAFVSESGALMASVLDWSRRENVGFSALVSTGGLLDVGWGDLIYHFGDDPGTRSIVLYMETVGDARKLLSAAREVALSKPVIVLKVGRSGPAAQAAASHTGTLAGSDEVLDAAFRRAGVLRVDTVAELFDMAEVLGKQARPAGPRLAIVSNAGGPGALAADALAAAGGEVADIGAPAREALHRLLPGRWNGGNPVDLQGDATPATYAKAVEALAADEANDGLLVVLSPQVATDAKATAEALAALPRPPGKPVLTSWMGGISVLPAQDVLNAAGFPTADYPDDAARAFCHMWRYSYALRGIYETPAQVADLQGQAPDRRRVEEIIAQVRAADRTLLTEVESKQLLGSYGIPVSPTHVALSENEVVRIANKLGYPVVVKLHSETLTHKTEVGGVQLNLRNPIAVREAWRAIETTVGERAHRSDFLGVTVQPMVVHNGFEVLLGSCLDEQFGPVLVFGTGGSLVEVFRDRALAIPPLNATLALRLMEQTRIFQALRGGRARKPVDLAALEALLVRFSYLVLEQPQIAEIDINPLIVADNTLVAVDARVVLHPPDLDPAGLPRPAIRPYPNQYVTRAKLKDGTAVVIRPIRPEDEPRLVEFHKTLSDRSVYNRYFVPLKLSERIAHERLVRVCFSDYDRDIPLVAEVRPGAAEPAQIIGIGRLGKAHQVNEGEFALIVSDAWQGRGLGRRLLELLIQVARDEKLDRLTGHILGGNREMQAVCRKLGFTFHHHQGDSECVAELDLGSSGSPR
jgi:acetyltransferase